MYGLIGPESLTDVEAGTLNTASIRVTDATATALTGTLTAGHLTPVDATAGNATYTLPAASTVAAGGVAAVKKADTSVNTVTVRRAGSDIMYGTGAGGTSRAVTLPGESAVFTSNGVNAWTVLASDTPVSQLDARFLKQTDASGTYAQLKTANPAGRSVPLGDSITFGSDNPSNGNSRGLSWPMYAEMLSDGKFHYNRNAGVTGNTSAQMLARFDTDVTPYAPTLVPLLAGRNDIGGAVSLTTFQANIAAIVAKIRGIGAIPWLFTIPPTTGTDGQTTRAWNAWLRAYATSNGIRITDAYEVLVDPATGSYLSAYDSGDHVHPSEAGYLAIGTRFAADLAGFANARPIPRLYDAADTSNKMQALNPLFLTTTITSNVPSGLSMVNPSALAGSSMITGDTTINGNWFRMTFAASASDVTLYKGSFVQTTVGNVYALTGLVNSQLTTAVTGGSLFIQVGTGAGTVYALYGGKTSVYKGRFWLKFTSAAVNINPAVFVKAGTTGTVDIAELALFDLTALGIDALV